MNEFFMENNLLLLVIVEDLLPDVSLGMWLSGKLRLP